MNPMSKASYCRRMQQKAVINNLINNSKNRKEPLLYQLKGIDDHNLILLFFLYLL